MNEAGARRPDYRDAGAVAIVVSIAIWLFRDHLLGRLTFLGNPDRLNTNLKVMKFYVDGLAGGGLHAWNPAEMLGYDAFAQPYTFPNPLTYLAAAFGAENVYVSAGFISCLLLGACGLTAYAFARRLLASRPCALLAAVLYQCSALSILKVSQNDMSFMVIVLLPVVALIVHRASPKTLASTYVWATIAFYALLQFCFLQKVAYALLFAGAYASYRAYEQRSFLTLAVLAAAVLTAFIGAAPRIYGLALAMGEYVRLQPEEKMDTFADLFRYQGVMAYQILRWFEDGIFGRYLADPTDASNGINLTEGFLLYTSPMFPLVVLGATLSRRREWKGFAIGGPAEPRFFLWFLALTIAVALLKPFNYLVHLLFFKVDFVHARILVVGLLPMVVYGALFLQRLDPAPHGEVRWRRAVLAAVLGIGAVGLVELIADRFDGSWRFSRLGDKVVSANAGTRALASGFAFAVLVLAATSTRLSAERRRLIFHALLVAVGVQAGLAANFRLNGKHTRNADVPFLSGDIYFAPREHFRIPSHTDTMALHARLERDKFRSVMICNPRSAGGFCAAHIGEYWRLRLADGYYGIGVPSRLAALPWSSGLGLRHILFTTEQQLPWKLLGFLNVRYAVHSNDYLYRYIARDAQPLRVLENPAHVVPRVFFAQSAAPARSPTEAKAILFDSSGGPDPEKLSVVEGWPEPRSFRSQGSIALNEFGDRIELTFEPADEERLLVLNELFSRRWRATVDGQPVPIYPTNVVMRGVLVPAKATRLLMEYGSLISIRRSAVALAIATLIAIAVALMLAKKARIHSWPRQ